MVDDRARQPRAFGARRTIHRASWSSLAQLVDGAKISLCSSVHPDMMCVLLYALQAELSD